MSWHSQAGPTGNRLLDRLPAADLRHVVRSVETLELEPGQVLFRSGDSLDILYFPTSSIVSLSAHCQRAPAIDVMSVGSEGVVGVTALFGVPLSPHDAICRLPGTCRRIPTAPFARAMARRPAVDLAARRYAAFAFANAIHVATCNALHSVEQRICRWLLEMDERIAAPVPATQQALAAILGVKRPTISIVAHALQTAGLITYHRGLIRVTDRSGLEARACYCYTAATAMAERILSS